MAFLTLLDYSLLDFQPLELSRFPGAAKWENVFPRCLLATPLLCK